MVGSPGRRQLINVCFYTLYSHKSVIQMLMISVKEFLWIDGHIHFMKLIIFVLISGSKMQLLPILRLGDLHVPFLWVPDSGRCIWEFSLENGAHFVSVSMCYQCEPMMVSLVMHHSDSRCLPSHSESFNYWVLVQSDTPIFICSAVVGYGWEGTRIPGSGIAASWQVLLSFANGTHFKCVVYIAKLRQFI